jgi:uncharacterized protein YjbI with pentapeptide repeats
MAEQPTCELKETRQRIEARKTNLSGSTFTDVNLAGAAFNDVELTEATIVNACLGEARIEDANLSGLQVEQVNLTRAAITECTMPGMTIDGVLVTDLVTAYRREIKHLKSSP